VSAVPVNNRVITIEEVFELKPRLPDCIALQTRPANLQGDGEIPLRKLIKEALRMRPSHLVVGEIREAEALIADLKKIEKRSALSDKIADSRGLLSLSAIAIVAMGLAIFALVTGAVLG
jgi:type IV secretory pathway ATPase VirB11/archaellum biosynthesis ATPase